MNVFWLDDDPVESAKAHCDQHVTKMITESAQILSTALFLNGYESPFPQPTHYRHPQMEWAAESRANYERLYGFAITLYEEKDRRWPGNGHKSFECKISLLPESPACIPDAGATEPPQCLGENADQYHSDNLVEAYREYYKAEKAGWARYNHSEPPEWLYETKTN